MATVVRREIRKRGFFGWIFLVLFLGFNAIMLMWVVGAAMRLNDLTSSNSAEQAGHMIGGTISFGIIAFFWVAGAVILGLFALLTRGRKTIIEEVG